MRLFKQHPYLQDLAQAGTSGKSTGRIGVDRGYHWSRRVVGLYAVTCLLVLVLVGAMGPFLAGVMGITPGARDRQGLRDAARLLGPVVSETGRAKLVLIRALIEEKFPDFGADTREEIAQALFVAGRRHGVDPLLALAIIRQESNYAHEAESFAGALGLMQVRPFVGEEMASKLDIRWEGRATLLDPARNIEIGIAYLAKMKRLYSNPLHALAAYNLGPYRLKGILERGEEVPNFYAERVQKFYRRYQRDYLTSREGEGLTVAEGKLALAGEI